MFLSPDTPNPEFPTNFSFWNVKILVIHNSDVEIFLVSCDSSYILCFFLSCSIHKETINILLNFRLYQNVFKCMKLAKKKLYWIRMWICASGVVKTLTVTPSQVTRVNFHLFISKNWVSCSPEWSWTWNVVQDDPELLVFLCPPSKCEIVGIHRQSVWCVGEAALHACRWARHQPSCILSPDFLFMEWWLECLESIHYHLAF